MERNWDINTTPGYLGSTGWPPATVAAPADGWPIATPAVRIHAQITDEQYAAMIETSGYAAVPLGGDDYIELLPVSWNAIGKEGVKLRRRTYDDKALVRFRGQRSGVTAKKNLWEVRYDPYDITRIWVRNHWDGGWIQVPWKHLRTAPAPFGELACSTPAGSSRSGARTPAPAPPPSPFCRALNRPRPKLARTATTSRILTRTSRLSSGCRCSTRWRRPGGGGDRRTGQRARARGRP